MRHGCLVLVGMLVTCAASAAGPAPAPSAPSTRMQHVLAHQSSLDACQSTRRLIHDEWRIHAFAVPDDVSDIMLAVTEGNTKKARAGLTDLPPNEVARWRQTALLTAVVSNQPDTVRALIADGAEPNARSWVPPYAKRFYRSAATAVSADPRFGKPTVVKRLQGSGLMQNQGQWIPLMLNQAANCDEANVIDALVRGGASVNARLPSGVGPLEVAVFEGNPKATRALLDHGADTCYFDHRAATYAKRTHRKLHALADIARNNGLPTDLVARLRCRAP